MRSFEQDSGPSRIVFGAGTLARVPEELARLGAHRALVLSTPGHRGQADRVVAALGEAAVGGFAEAVMHTPVEVTERAVHRVRALRADALVSIGGGSTTGLGKAVAARTGLPHLVLPTTYAGSEVTALLGETIDGEKVTRTSAEIRPDTVIYDVELTVTLPWAITVTSAVNAMAHAVEALYAPDRSSDSDRQAVDSIRALSAGLRTLPGATDPLPARTELLYGAWLAGSCLGSVTMGLHHKLCHTLGGSFGLAHAATHTVVLPFAMDYNRHAAPGAMAAAAHALGVADAPAGLQRFIADLGGPTSLSGLGFEQADVSRAADLAVARPYPNPREVRREWVVELLTRATDGSAIPGPD